MLNGLDFYDFFHRISRIILLCLSVIFFRRLFLSRIPYRLFSTLVMIFICRFFTFVFIIRRRSALRRYVKRFRFTCFVNRCLTGISRRFVITINGGLDYSTFFCFNARFFFDLRGVFTRCLIRGLLIRFTICRANGLFCLRTRITFCFNDDFFVSFRR